ncbi:MAG: flagellar basal body-associated FliL family protein [Archangium sp.]|nr:flagellar basal body-associated FliL family protein [Archangium sp.]
MSEPKKDAATETPPPPPAAKNSKLMPILVGLNSLLLIGVLGFMGYTMSHPPAAAPVEKHDDAEEEKGEEPKAEKAEKAEPKAEAKEEKGEKKEGEGHGAPGAVGSGPGPMVKLPDFVIHLRNPELDRYARMSFDVEVFGEPDKERLNANLPRVRDAIISYLSDRTLEELRGSEGLTRTKDALQQKLRELVPEARIRALYISDFVVQ